MIFKPSLSALLFSIESNDRLLPILIVRFLLSALNVHHDLAYFKIHDLLCQVIKNLSLMQEISWLMKTGLRSP